MQVSYVFIQLVVGCYKDKDTDRYGADFVRFSQV